MSKTDASNNSHGAHNGAPALDLVQIHPALPKLLRNTRRALHAQPELGYKEVKTSHMLQSLLASRGLDVKGPVAHTGFYVDIVGAHDGPSVGYRADMDGLPVKDAKQVPYASRNEGISHACGHDAHMAIGAGVALTLHRLRLNMHGKVRVFFQPNEEGAPSGSLPMIKYGILKDLEALYCIHVDPTLDVGTYGLIDGTVTAASDRFRVRLDARATGHSARPHKAKDTIWIASQLLNHYYQLVGRITDARNPSVLTVCIFKAGTAHNVIPKEVEFEGGLRFLGEADRDFLREFMLRAAEQFGALHGVRIDLRFFPGLPSVVNDHTLVSHVRRTIEALFTRRAIHEIPVPSMGSEDFANYLEYRSGMLLRVGTRSNRHTSYPLHDANFDLDERALAPTVQLMSTVLMSHLHQNIMEQQRRVRHA